MNSTTHTATTTADLGAPDATPPGRDGGEDRPARRPRRWPHGPLRAGLVWPRLAWWLEVATIGVGYLVYETSRALTAPQRTVAVAHGDAIIRAERWAHLDPEVALSHLINLWDPLSDAAGYYYSTLHFAITPLVLVYVWWRHPEVYPRLRSALVLATITGLVIFITWPVAPPRLTHLGVTDTLVQHHIMGMSDPHGVTGLINQYAAMPSLHVGWAVWCALAVVATSRSPWRHLAWLYPVATTFVVLSTGNHYLFDAIGGALLVLAAVAVTAPGRVAPLPAGPVLQRPDTSPDRSVPAGGGRRGGQDPTWTPRAAVGDREASRPGARRCRRLVRDR